MTCEGEELLEKDLDLVEGKVMRKYLQGTSHYRL